MIALCCIALGLSFLTGLMAEERSGNGRTVMLLDVKGGIGVATTDYLRRGLARAEAEGAHAVVLRIDTPGGLDAATRDINQLILASRVPVIGYVAPEGARAASAGTYILYATHLAAMAPATSLGAATPVSMGGQEPSRPPTRERGRDEEGNEAERDPEPDGGAMARKVTNDAVAYLRGLAERRGRNAEFAEAAVRDAATLTSSEALEQQVIELVATGIQDLLRQADGRTVRIGEQERTLATADAEVVSVEPDWRNRLLATITDPAIAYFLLMIGLYGLIFEGYNPGAIVPGVIGAIALLLAMYALQVLPVNYAGVGLILLGVILMVSEMFLPSFGALGIGGLVALVAGSIMLFDSDVPGFAAPTRMIAGFAILSGGSFMAVLYMAVRARRRPVTTGEHELVGQQAVVVHDFTGRGHVRIRGEIWQADSSQPLIAGQAQTVLPGG